MTSEDSIFQNHYNYYKSVGIETIKINSGQIDQVSADYQGRVLYELLQNAFDKATKNILVQVKNNSLYVANDGSHFTYNANHDYVNGNTESAVFKRYDFQSICSISTSSKNLSESIGNKGVGFKSVYSIANYANIHTKGKVIDNGNIIDKAISFRLYDSFKDIDQIPDVFDESVKEKLKENINAIQKEDNLKNRGVPGYYYPLFLSDKSEFVNELFEQGYITVIEVPFTNSNEVEDLFKEIEDIHFDFVQLKYPDKDFDITFNYDGTVVKKEINKNSNNFFFVEITNSKIYDLAQSAGVSIDQPKVAICIKDTPSGKLYNYLPTKKDSPFKYIDFHADFHTKVDRTDVNFAGEKVGAYNQALMKACLELFLCVINSYLPKEEQLDLKLNYIDKEQITHTLIEFDWKLLEFNGSDIVFHKVRNVLRIRNVNKWDYSYALVSEFLSELGHQYFKVDRKIEEHNQFFDTINNFVNYFGREYSQQYSWLDFFKEEIALNIKKKVIKIIPETYITETSEVLYRENSEKILDLPIELGISLTKFEVKDKVFRKLLGINEFNDYNEILKYFKQVSYSGKYEKEKLTDNQQISLLRSLAEIMNTKKDDFLSSSHRYSRSFTAEERKNHSVINQAYFNISTVFLKTTSKKYKPAQLCKKVELDGDFIKLIGLGERLDSFLKFIGVSLDNGYIFTDKRIYDSLNDGIDYIPILNKRNESVEKLYGEALLKNVRLVNNRGNKIHPSIIDKNNYNFLQNISNRIIENELEDLRAGKYEHYPVEYLNILFDIIKELPNGIDRLYLRLFYPFHKFLNKYLTTTKGELAWKQKDDCFYIAQNRQDFEILRKYDIPLLNYFNGNDLPDELKKRKVTLSEGDIKANDKKEITTEFKDLLNSRMHYLLSAISNTNLSELNYKENSSRIKEIYELLDGCQVFECKKLSRDLICIEADLNFDNISDALCDRIEKKIYFKENCSKKNKAEVIAKYFFNNTSIASELELILFFKDLSELEVDFTKEDLSLFRKLWIKDYDKIFKEFQKEILNGYIDEAADFPQNWYSYNKSDKSNIILKLYNENKLNDLEQKIDILKLRYENMFDDFKLDIDYSLNDTVISKMISFLESLETEKNKDLINELKDLSKCIGIENRITEIERLLIEKYQYQSNVGLNDNEIGLTNQKLDFERKVSQILYKLPQINSFITETFSAKGVVKTESLTFRSKRLIFQGKGSTPDNEKYLEDTGATGEVQVLGYYIGEFLLLSVDKRVNAINQIYDVISKKLGDNSHLAFKEECLRNIEDDENLRKALIPYMYIALNHKFAYLDLVAYKNGKPTIVEVKTTQNNNNNSFYISKSEVDEAREEPYYEIIRVTQTEIIFMGNPIKELGDKLILASGDNYKLIPRNFKFEFSKKD